jgi:hypothetical protein
MSKLFPCLDLEMAVAGAKKPMSQMGFQAEYMRFDS